MLSRSTICRRQELAAEIPRALDEDLFRLVFQPIATLHGNSVEK
jgi:EAL domain-containing protein (putative c-di-GMP-specific phosphodiesterase class I)